jgi:hypothetical protein
VVDPAHYSAPVSPCSSRHYQRSRKPSRGPTSPSLRRYHSPVRGGSSCTGPMIQTSETTHSRFRRTLRETPHSPGRPMGQAGRRCSSRTIRLSAFTDHPPTEPSSRKLEVNHARHAISGPRSSRAYRVLTCRVRGELGRTRQRLIDVRQLDGRVIDLKAVNLPVRQRL